MPPAQEVLSLEVGAGSLTPLAICTGDAPMRDKLRKGQMMEGPAVEGQMVEGLMVEGSTVKGPMVSVPKYSLEAL